MDASQDLRIANGSGVIEDPEAIDVLRMSPLLDPVWYRQTYPDLRDAPIDVARHYLEHGAREGRNPHPLFDTRYYLQQNPDVADLGINPLLHYLLYGATEGRRPHPLFDTKLYLAQNPDAATSGINPLLHYTLYGAGGNDSSRPPGCASLDIAEPGIKPPPLVPTSELPASELYRRNAEIVSAVRALKAKNGRDELATAQLAPPLDEIHLACAKLGSIGAADGSTIDVMTSSLRDLLIEVGGNLSIVEMLTGLGITPRNTIDEICLPQYAVPILQRYNRERLEITRRFDLDPLRASTMEQGPRISILLPVYRPPVVFLERAILSVLFQTYANWELLIVDDCSNQRDVEAMVKYYATVDKRIKARFSARNGGISAATNVALEMAGGEYVGLLDHDDMLTRDALEHVGRRLLEESEIDLVYSDECKIDAHNVVDDLFHKPDWSPHALFNCMYTGHFSVYRKALVERVGGFRSEFDFSQDYDLALRVSEQAPKVSHIEECLYGWRMIAGSAATGDKPTARLSNIAALQSAIDRRGYDGVATALPTANCVLRRHRAERPLVSIVVPSDNFSNIRDTVELIRSQTSYENYEIVVVANSKLIAAHGARLISNNTCFVDYDEPYSFSDKCNRGAGCAKGDFVVFFNDDVRVISADWIDGLLEYLTLPGVGVVGPKLLYENGAIQHAGMVTGVRRLVGTAFHAYPGGTTAYFNMAQSVREVSLICGACLAMPMRVFDEVGGFDGRNTPVAHSDVDLCFRVRELGYSCVYTPHAELTHIGHVSIGAAEAETKESAKALKRDKADIFLLKRWGEYCARDPYFPAKMRDLVYIDSQENFVLEKGRASSVSATGKDFILFSHDLSGSGAPRCLHHIAEALIDAGHYVLVVSPEDGVYRKRFTDIGADVIVDPLALSGHPSVIDLAKNFDAVICNTIVCWPVPAQLAAYAPVYLYVHESELIRHYVDNVPGFREGLASAAAIWAAGPLAKSAIRNYCGLDALNLEGSVEELPHFGEEDKYSGATIIAMAATLRATKRAGSRRPWIQYASRGPSRELPLSHGGPG